MTKPRGLRPWHQVVRLKEELRTGELALAEFAADLHDVALAQGRRPVYEDPAKFFALTYPTHALRELVKDVAARLEGHTQAVGKVDTAAMVASILATAPRKQRGELGGRLTSELADVFRKQREEGVQPVQKEDVPVVLRRRFF